MIATPVTQSAATSQREPVVCDIQHKRLVMLGAEGLFVWCKSCHREHCISWDELDRVRQTLQQPPAPLAVS